MNNTFGRAADTPTRQELTFGHFACLDKVIGPYNLLNSTNVALSPKNDYFTGGSIISTADDLSKFSRFLLNKGRGIFSADAIVADMITGHVIRPVSPQIPPVLTGQTLNPDGGAYSAGYGFDTVGDVMFGQHYFDKGGDSLVCKTRNGFIPSRRLGVTLLSNARRLVANNQAISSLISCARSFWESSWMFPSTLSGATFATLCRTLTSCLPCLATSTTLMESQ
ncbi:hypothetical protein AC1031_014357 [Aphanomyces cochlioides]|nr:hypothetical protein AC1031_014357 [Aphanomyces cochlioides]